MIELRKINEAIQDISNSIDHENWQEALIASYITLEHLTKYKKEKVSLQLYFNLAAQFIDVSTYLRDIEGINIGIKILEDNFQYFEEHFQSNFYYNLANAKLAIANDFGYTDDEINFKNIDLYNDVKNLYWKAFKVIKKEEDFELYCQNLINLANTLKQQYRFSEALQIYNIMIEQKVDYPQAWLNRSSCLEQFDQLLDHRSHKMINEIIKGYDFACKSDLTPSLWKPYYLKKTEYLRNQLSQNNEEIDDLETQKEYFSMSIFRQWCVKENLTLNTHGLYCSCIINERDTLTLFENIIANTDIINFEQYLNRVKSEFSLLRVLYFESLNHDSSPIDYETCYSELNENEIININSEKLRTSFRLCFSILDKLAIVICKYFNFAITKTTYFHNFWKTNKIELEKSDNFGLIALYSIIQDLNDKAQGEFGFYKEWRNSLEHNLLFIVPNNSKYTTDDDHVYIEIDHFKNNLKNLIQITRSAIFSTVFTLLHEYRKNEPSDERYWQMIMEKKNFGTNT